MKQRKHREVILQACITFYHLEHRSDGCTYKTEEEEPDVHREKLEQEARRVIESELPSELRQIYGLEAKTQFIAIRDGSLIVFFSALVTGIGIIASYSDFFESIELIKKHARMLLKRTMHRLVSLETEVDVSAQFPRMPEPEDMFWPRRFRKRMGHFAEEFFSSGFPWGVPSTPCRDGFFWWLLIMNMVLLAVIALLVGAAVKRTYFSDEGHVQQSAGAYALPRAAQP